VKAPFRNNIGSLGALKKPRGLSNFINEGKSYDELAQIFGRNKKAVQQKVYDMGLKRESVKPNHAPPTPKPNPKPSNPNSHSNNNIRKLLEGSLQLLPSYPFAAKTLIREAIEMLQK
jgi:hypothetical protein